MLTMKTLRGRLNPFRNVKGYGVFDIGTMSIFKTPDPLNPTVRMVYFNTPRSDSTKFSLYDIYVNVIPKQGMQRQAEDNEGVNVGNTEDERNWRVPKLECLFISIYNHFYA